MLSLLITSWLLYCLSSFNTIFPCCSVNTQHFVPILTEFLQQTEGKQKDMSTSSTRDTLHNFYQTSCGFFRGDHTVMGDAIFCWHLKDSYEMSSHQCFGILTCYEMNS